MCLHVNTRTFEHQAFKFKIKMKLTVLCVEVSEKHEFFWKLLCNELSW